MMFHFRRAAASKLTLICTLLILPGHSWAIDLAGAWASSADQCSNVFKKTKIESHSFRIRIFTARASLLTRTSSEEELPDARSNQEGR
jgi:hypothetical protein